MSTTHTPVPWHVNAIRKGRVIGDANAEGAEKYQICNHHATVATVYRRTDAPLVAAAPELLAACQALVAIELPKKPGRRCGYCNFIHCDTSKCPVALASAAIAKAKGGAS